MRRKKDDKRVLRAGNGRDTRSSRIKNKKRSFSFSNNRPPAPPQYRQKSEKKRSGKTVLIMSLVLLAFVIGAGIGIMFGFDNESDINNTTANVTKNETHVENVTIEMTTNLNQTEPVTFDEADAVDYNENQTDIILKDENREYYEPYADIEP